MSVVGSVAAALFAAAAAWGQTAFEVASIKPVLPPTPEQILSGKARHGMKIDGARVDIGGATLASLILSAYRVKRYQISGPDWMNGQNFDILAKLPEGASREQVPEMLQGLLAERFKLVMHREDREYQVYALIVGKNGTKLKPAPADAVPAFRSSMNPDGTIHSQQTASLAMFADFLTPYVDRPVLDMTEMKGLYQIGMDLARQSRTDPAFGTEFIAAVEQLGLKLDSRKVPMETIVVDHLERTPTDN